MSAGDGDVGRRGAAARAILGGVALIAAGCSATAPVGAGATPRDHAVPGTPSSRRGSAPPPVSASSTAPRAARGVVLLVRTPRHLEAALKTAGTLRASGEADGGRRPVHVIACGDAIDAVLQGASAEPRLRVAVASGVVVTACGMTLEEKGIAASRLSAAVTMVPNGLIEAVRLQEAGFVSIEL